MREGDRFQILLKNLQMDKEKLSRRCELYAKG
jgi:hypothetical protein